MSTHNGSRQWLLNDVETVIPNGLAGTEPKASVNIKFEFAWESPSPAPKDV
jgi:hypothetical protein